jgi:SH3-like domain-containing protein
MTMTYSALGVSRDWAKYGSHAGGALIRCNGLGSWTAITVASGGWVSDGDIWGEDGSEGLQCS